MALFSLFLFWIVLESATLQRHSLSAYRNATCNDGTSAVYYYLKGSKDNLWVVDLQGGGWCYDDESCTKRCGAQDTTLCGSSNLENKQFPPTKTEAGVLGTYPDSPVSNAHKIFVLYCSSDGWMGRSDSGPLHHQYKGSLIVEATFEDLVVTHGLGKNLNETTTIVFGGQSAGGRGAMFNIDHISNWFSRREDLNVRVMGWLDSPYWIPVNPMYGQISLLDQAKMIYAYADNDEVLREKCVEAYPDQKHFCMFGYYTMPFVESRSVMESATFDTFQLGVNIGHYPRSSKEVSFAYDFAIAIGRDMKLLAEQNSNVIVFGPACCNHAVSTSDAFDSMKSNNLSEAAMLAKLLSTSPPYNMSDGSIDTCAEDRRELCCGAQQNSIFFCPLLDI